jgi:hypothetical protein
MQADRPADLEKGDKVDADIAELAVPRGRGLAPALALALVPALAQGRPRDQEQQERGVAHRGGGAHSLLISGLHRYICMYSLMICALCCFVYTPDRPYNFLGKPSNEKNMV